MRLIDADELRDNIDNYPFTEYCDYSNVIDMIDDAPTIEAEPVKHGWWIIREKTKLIPTGKIAVAEGHVLTKTSADKPFTMQEANLIPLKVHKVVKYAYCSVCGNYDNDEYNNTAICSYCGAIMDGESKKEEDVEIENNSFFAKRFLEVK